MAYSTSNPPAAISQPLTRGSTTQELAAHKPGLWLYASTNLTTDLTAAGFFSNAYALGMRTGDVVIGYQYTATGSSMVGFQGCVGTISTAGAAALTTGSMFTSTFRSS